jgi:RNA polymerase sigma factor for flagellar operon FliA
MPDSPGDLYLSHRPVIESVVRFVCRRRGLRGDDAEEFAAEVRLRLVESDYEILRKFQGRSSLQTYLTVVIQRLALDFQAARWGRWRPSALARAAGAEGIRLEQLIVRDGLTLPDAVTIVERESGPVDRARLEALAARFPLRVRRQYVGEELLEMAAADSPDAERLLVRADEEARFERIKARLTDMLAALAPSERLVLQLRFEQGMKVADIARLQQVDQKRLYRQIQQALTRLRTILEAEGVDASAVRTMLAAVEPEETGREAARSVRLYEKNTP